MHGTEVLAVLAEYQASGEECVESVLDRDETQPSAQLGLGGSQPEAS